MCSYSSLGLRSSYICARYWLHSTLFSAPKCDPSQDWFLLPKGNSANTKWREVLSLAAYSTVYCPELLLKTGKWEVYVGKFMLFCCSVVYNIYFKLCHSACNSIQGLDGASCDWCTVWGLWSKMTWSRLNCHWVQRLIDKTPFTTIMQMIGMYPVHITGQKKSKDGISPT